VRLTPSSLLLAAVAVIVGACFVSGDAGAEAAAQRHCLWKVSGAQGTVYLLGTVHVGRTELYPLPRIIEDSFKQADTLVEEVDTGDPQNTAQIKQWLGEHSSYPPGDTVASHLSADTRAHLAAFLKKSGQSETAVARLRPWLIAVLVIQSEAKQLGFDPERGLDKHFLEEASEAQKPVKGMETADAQLQLFASLPDGLQDQLLLSTLLEAEKPASLVDSTVEAWKAGDLTKIQDLMDRVVREHPELKPLMTKLFDERDAAMTAQIEQFLATPKTYFIAVGAGHLAGENGILHQLQAKHFTVQQL
jgi:uncharacterized protein